MLKIKRLEQFFFVLKQGWDLKPVNIKNHYPVSIDIEK